jgi:hypothetical protein
MSRTAPTSTTSGSTMPFSACRLDPVTVGSSMPSAIRLSDSPGWTTRAHAGSWTPGGSGVVLVVGVDVVDAVDVVVDAGAVDVVVDVDVVDDVVAVVDVAAVVLVVESVVVVDVGVEVEVVDDRRSAVVVGWAVVVRSVVDVAAVVVDVAAGSSSWEVERDDEQAEASAQALRSTATRLDLIASHGKGTRRPIVVSPAESPHRSLGTAHGPRPR